VQPTGANVSQYSSEGITTYTVKQRMSLRTTDIKKAEAAIKRQFDLVKQGVELEEGSGMSFTYTKLNAIKPPMIAEATKDARKSAEQFAKDSGTGVDQVGKPRLFRSHRPRWREQRRMGRGRYTL
jgi:uncharacterized protein